jgi:NAD+ kinase
MMKTHFKTIALIGKPNHYEALKTLTKIYHWLEPFKVKVLAEPQIAKKLRIPDACTLDEIGKKADLAIVVGGDGQMLGAARVLCRHKVKVIGVNRGHLGFLTDIKPDDFEQPLEEILKGKFVLESRFLLEVELYRHNQLQSTNHAMNEIVLHAGKVAHMIEFEIYIDDAFMYSQRADGIIIATPTGSTAYALSAGGSILSPDLSAVMLLPMFPHTFSARPIAIDSNHRIKLVVAPENNLGQSISCDGQIHIPVLAGDEILIKRSKNKLDLIHPEGYSYYEVLRTKLKWGSKLF